MRRAVLWVIPLVLCFAAGMARAWQPAWASNGSNEATDALAVDPAPLAPDAAAALTPISGQPLLADDSVSDESIYANTPLVSPQDQDINSGGVNLSLDFSYGTRYVYRGVDHDNVAAHSDSLNLLIDSKLSFDFGQYPHPFVGVFTNIYDADPVSRFQEIRPYLGADWNLRPFLLEGGQISYIYPQREGFNASEFYGKVTLDDSWIFNTTTQLVSPYVEGAYDYHANNGWYVEVGLKHDIPIEDWGLVITAQAAAGYIAHIHQQFIFVNTVKETGWQHAEFGLSASYNLNTLFNIPKRFGEFDLQGYVYDTNRISTNITADNVLWSGAGIGFKY